MKIFYIHLPIFCLAALIVTALLVASPVAAASRVQEQQFFESMADIPLMPGLYEALDDSLVFDKPEGRIAEALAASRDLTAAEIRTYYAQTLPQMGWAPAGPDSFARKDEILTLGLSAVQGLQILRIRVAPR